MLLFIFIFRSANSNLSSLRIIDPVTIQRFTTDPQTTLFKKQMSYPKTPSDTSHAVKSLKSLGHRLRTSTKTNTGTN